MITYLLKSILCLLVLLLIHRLILQREVLHRFNRFFLLGAVIGSFLIPLITIEVQKEMVESPIPELVQTWDVSEGERLKVETPNLISESSINKYQESQTQFPWMDLGLGLYGVVCLVFLVRFIRNLVFIRKEIRNGFHHLYRGETLVLIEREMSPFSFLRYIFFPKFSFEKSGISEAVFLHEQCHVRERHSWDILFLEALLIPFWFHPGLHWARQSIRLNHEFIADSAALKRIPASKYQHELLSYLVGMPNYPLTSSLNFSLTKKRLQMMTSKPNYLKQWAKILGLVPILGLLAYSFASKEQIEPKSPENINSDLKEENLIDLSKKAEYYSKTIFLIENEAMEYARKTFLELTEEQKNRLLEPLEIPQKKSPDLATFENWKNKEMYGIWLDRRYISNEKLDELKPSDIVYFQGSYIQLNARSEQFPQSNQFYIYTQEGFEKEFIKNPKYGKHLEATITFTHNRGIWGKDLEKDPDPNTAYLQKNAYYEKLRTSRNIYANKTSEEKALLGKLYEELKFEYDQATDALRKQLKEPIQPDSDRKRFDYSSEEPSEKITSVSNPINRGIEKSYSFVYASGGMPLDEYLIRYGQFQTKVNANRLFTMPSNFEIEALRKEFDALQASFLKLSIEERKKVQRVSFPYARIEKDGVVTYKKFEDLTEEERATMTGC